MNWTHQTNARLIEVFPQPARRRTTLVRNKLVQADWPDVTLVSMVAVQRDIGKKCFAVAGLVTDLDDLIPSPMIGLCLGDIAQRAVDCGVLTLSEAFWHTDFSAWQGEMLFLFDPDYTKKCRTERRSLRQRLHLLGGGSK